MSITDLILFKGIISHKFDILFLYNSKVVPPSLSRFRGEFLFSTNTGNEVDYVAGFVNSVRT
jgi:hypothetical protein